MFDVCSKPYDKELEAFGENWCGPGKYEFFVEILVARYEKDKGNDGQDCEVFCTAMPARFYTIRARRGINSVGNSKEPWEFGTGASQAQLAADIAQATAWGMLGFHPQINLPSEPIPTPPLITNCCVKPGGIWWELMGEEVDGAKGKYHTWYAEVYENGKVILITGDYDTKELVEEAVHVPYPEAKRFDDSYDTGE